MLKRISILLFFCFVSIYTTAQLGSKRCKWVYVSSEYFELDSLTVYPNSIQLNYPEDSSVSIVYDINSNKARLISNKTIDSIYVCFSVLPYKLNRPYYKRDINKYDSNSVYRENYAYRNFITDKKEELFSSPGINKSGNISRGISFGNNQNVFVNSILNLQLEGRLTEDVSITAVISDQNIPFQPEGNTQQIQEFDKVYVQLKSKKNTLTAGDLVMKNQPSHFLKYYRNVQGGQIELSNINKDSTIKSYTTAGVAISKGKFNSIQFGFGLPDSLAEGVQGPYRLRGPNGERFIIVLANSEKVYLDGKLLKRGWDYDYIIDYNQAEITFTNNVLITRFSRVRVDFEFSDKNYGRSIMNFSHYQDYKKTHAFINYYAEKDNPNNPLLFSLSEQDKQFLSGIGDTLNRAVISGADSVEYTKNKPLYKKVNQLGEEVFVYSVNPDSAYYDVRFTDVGAGMGRYVLENNLVNGRLFTYVGLPNGNYEPVQIIATPKKKQMITVGGGVDITKTDLIYGEAAFSLNDINLYSNLDSEDDKGFAYKIGYLNSGRKLTFLPKYQWLSSVDYEFNDKKFEAIDRFRSTDFERDWNENVKLKTENNIFNVSTGIVKDEKNKVNYLLSRREKPGDVNGTQHSVVLNQSMGKLQFLGTGFLLNSNSLLEKTNWKKGNTALFYNSSYFVPGVNYNFDHSQIRDTSGEIKRTVMYFDEQKFYLKNNDARKFNFLIDYSVRKDKEVYLGAMADNSKTETTNLSVGGRIKDNHYVNSNFTYRYQNNDIGPTKIQDEETVMGKGEWNADFFKRHVRSELMITSATGRELRRQFVYIAVAPGLGTHVWNDFNGDGKQQLNEFLEKVFDDPNGEFIKTFTPTDQYIKAYTNNFNYRLDASAPRNWRGAESRIKRFISKFSNVSSITVNKKLLDRNIVSRFVPFYSKIPDTSLISYQNLLRSTLFFNRTNPSYGIELNYSNIESKQFLIQGYDDKNNTEIGLLNRVNIKKYFSVKLGGSHLVKSSISSYLIDRNYKVEGWKVNPNFAFQPKNTFRLSLNMSYTDKINVYESGLRENAQLYETGLEAKFNKLSRRTFTANVKYINIAANLRGAGQNTPLAYELFEALQLGKNYTWTAVWQEKLVNGLQLSFNYEGRKMGNSNVIHIGRMQVSALF